MIDRPAGRVRKPSPGTPFSIEITSAWLTAHGNDTPIAFDPNLDHVDLVDDINAALADIEAKAVAAQADAAAAVAAVNGGAVARPAAWERITAADGENGFDVLRAGAYRVELDGDPVPESRLARDGTLVYVLNDALAHAIDIPAGTYVRVEF